MPSGSSKCGETAVYLKPGKKCQQIAREVNLRILDFELEGLKNSSMTSSAQNSHFKFSCLLI